jgi:hypothetical protein
MKLWQRLMRLPGVRSIVTELPDAGEHYGVLGEFDDTESLLEAAERIRDAGFTQWDAFSPFPVHGLERAMGIKGSILPRFVLVGALGGGLAGITLQWYTSAVAYPLVISGKPFFSWQAFIPVTFELAVLGGAVAAVVAMLHLCRLPTLHHPLFDCERFARASDDRFFIAVDARDPNYDADAVQELLRSSGAAGTEIVTVGE